MIDQLTKLSAIERLELYLDYLENRKHYPKEEREKLDNYFEGL